MPSSFWLEFNQREAVPGNPEATLQSTLNMPSTEFIILSERGARALMVPICPSKKSRHPLQILCRKSLQFIHSTSFLLPPFGIQISSSINCIQSCLSTTQSLYSATRVIFLITLLSCLILQRLPTAHRIKAKSPLAGCPPGPEASATSCHFPLPPHIHSAIQVP